MLILPVSQYAQETAGDKGDYNPPISYWWKIERWIKNGEFSFYNKTFADTTAFTNKVTVSLTETTAGLTTEVLKSTFIADVQTGSWVNAIVENIDYTTGSSGNSCRCYSKMA